MARREALISLEKEFDTRSIGIATATFYPKWQPVERGSRRSKDDVDGVRGDLAIKTIAESQRKGFQIAIVDGGSSTLFKKHLETIGVATSEEKEKGMSGSRRQAFKEVSAMKNVKVVSWVEPEKISIVRDCLPKSALPILKNEADIVIPQRNEHAFQTYPDFQAKYEQRANKAWNQILRKNKLLSEKDDDIDAWVGPRFIRNEPEVLSLFLDAYEFDQRNQKHYQMIKPDLWPNALFLPVVAALHKGLKVKSIPVEYRHPPEQTAIEKDNEVFNAKREEQFRNILVTTSHFIHHLNGEPKRLYKRS